MVLASELMLASAKRACAADPVSRATLVANEKEQPSKHDAAERSRSKTQNGNGCGVGRKIECSAREEPRKDKQQKTTEPARITRIAVTNVVTKSNHSKDAEKGDGTVPADVAQNGNHNGSFTRCA